MFVEGGEARGFLGNFGEILMAILRFPKIRLPKIPQNSPNFPIFFRNFSV